MAKEIPEDQHPFELKKNSVFPYLGIISGEEAARRINNLGSRLVERIFS